MKLENLLLANEQEGITSIRVADFGLAKILDDEGLASTACGTPGYVAPEILREEKYGPSCDIWSIGIITYILLCGELPFEAEDQLELFNKIKKCEFKPDPEIWVNISTEA